MREGKTNTLVIRTPEGIAFALPLAGPVTRFFAWGIDAACIMVIISCVSILLELLLFLGAGVALAVSAVAYFLISIGYGIVTEWYWRGQTLGKRMLRLRVVDAQGLRLQPSQIIIRNLLRVVDLIPFMYMVGGIACLVSRRAQRLGDFAANTVVIRIQAAPEPDLRQLESGKFNSFREYPHLEARLRQRASPEEAALALQALLRRAELDPLARIELFEEIAQHFRSLVAFPEEATLGLTDEQYVRNVVDTLFTPRAKERTSAA